MSILNSIQLPAIRRAYYNYKAHCVKMVYVSNGEPRNMIRQRFTE